MGRRGERAEPAVPRRAPAPRCAADGDDDIPARRSITTIRQGSAMTKMGAVAQGVSIAVLACASVLPASALAQAGNAGGRPPAADASKPAKVGGVSAGPGSLDMRLWSFGDCTKNFPYADAPEHKECIRVVGSDEAKDARAIYFCSVSHAKDPAEATRCKEAYFANKSEAEQEGFRARMTNPVPAAAAAVPPPKRDKEAEIAALTRALTAVEPEEPAAEAAAPPAAAAPAPPPASGSIGNVLLGLAVFLLLAAIGLRYLRKVSLGSVAPDTTSRRVGPAKRSSGVHFAR